jgi:signal transduction histidine kinase
MSRAATVSFASRRAEAKRALADIRRIAHDLRPPTLDEFGLIGAIRQQADRLVATDARSRPLSVTVDSAGQLPPLPAAVEVAAYRIALEALTNVSRHAQASTCSVRIAVNGALEVEVADDGRGLDRAAPGGLGIVSMRERAEELGGQLELAVPPGGRGTVVRAELPLEA